MGGWPHGDDYSWTLWWVRESLVAPHTSVTTGNQSKSTWPEIFRHFSILLQSEQINSATNCGISHEGVYYAWKQIQTEKEGNRCTKDYILWGCVLSLSLLLYRIANLACLIKGWRNHMTPHSTTATVYISDWKSVVRPSIIRTWVCFKSSHTTWWNWQNPGNKMQ